jgi:hypothetical protein
MKKAKRKIVNGFGEQSKEQTSKQTNNSNIMANLGDAPYVVFALDSTGSMASCVDECRRNLKDLIQQLLHDNPRTRVGFVLFGDYCDEELCISIKDFCNDAEEIANFIQSTPNTGGGDEPECYELVLNKVADMDWTEAGGALVLVGDAYPHPAAENREAFRGGNNPDNLDWQEELQRLLEKNIKVFPCQCLYSDYNQKANTFWSGIAETCKTPLLKMDFKDSSHTLGAIAYTTAGGSDGLRSYMTSHAVSGFAASSATFTRSAEVLTKYARTLENEDPKKNES